MLNDIYIRPGLQHNKPKGAMYCPWLEYTDCNHLFNKAFKNFHTVRSWTCIEFYCWWHSFLCQCWQSLAWLNLREKMTRTNIREKAARHNNGQTMQSWTWISQIMVVYSTKSFLQKITWTYIEFSSWWYFILMSMLTIYRDITSVPLRSKSDMNI